MPSKPVRAIKIAIFAMGGEGGGVLADWIVDVAEHDGYLAQTTSVPGVAQRTGATVYYLELFPRAAAAAAGKEPVLALMPVPGDVDIVIASELMEAGRAVQRGFVTPGLTTLIASTHRVYSMTERIALADGRVDESALREGCEAAAKRMIAFDMTVPAQATGSVISAVLYGALAGADSLPFARPAFEAAIRRGGVGVEASLAAFGAGFGAAKGGQGQTAAIEPAAEGTAAPHGDNALAALIASAERGIPEPAASLIRAGIERVADYQDLNYARLYLERLKPFAEIERQQGDTTVRLLAETARQLALAMAYEDTIRVAELKIRPSRFARVREEVKAGDHQIVEISEYMHPRVEEIADTLPAGLGRWLLRTVWARNLVGHFTASGRVVKTTSIHGFLMLYMVAAMKPLRARSLRFATETAAIDDWLMAVQNTARKHYELAIEVAEARNLVRGYGDTHERGRARFDTLTGVLPKLLGEPGAAETFALLRKAAEADETGAALKVAIERLPIFAQAAE